MTPIDLYLDVNPLQRETLAVADEVAVLPVARVPVGIGATIGFLKFQGGNAVSVSAIVDHTTQIYDTALDWDPTIWGIEVDAAASVTAIEHGIFTLTVDGGPGLRIAILGQPWWDDYVYAGVGAHMAFTGTFGKGKVRPLIAVRGSAQAIPGSATGTLDSAVQDLTWAWTPSSARLGVQVGVALR